MNSIKPYISLLSINKYYTTNSIKPFIVIQFIILYTTNCIKPFVAIQFIILNFCRQLLFCLCIGNYHIKTDKMTCTKITLIK